MDINVLEYKLALAMSRFNAERLAEYFMKLRFGWAKHCLTLEEAVEKIEKNIHRLANRMIASHKDGESCSSIISGGIAIVLTAGEQIYIHGTIEHSDSYISDFIDYDEN